ncbi:HNH endonuclease [Streptomonospora sp. PA3]|uniref:HNH endonuclease family protein n=1 Tax=Streptomonospora sp. PA3 TaxID=2607326 RepID=UPI0012DD4537|nr:HNH endonuclease family protein [Streptomonospora sp. PA3]MUL43476.1 HNH endonuclease [Streptomonospora sp. PA3]
MARARSRPRVPPRPARFGPARAAAALVLAAAVLAGCDALPWPEADGPPAPPSPSAPPPAPAADPPTGAEVERARALLRAAEVAPEGSGAGYEREEFGSSWIDADGNGCPTRHDVLARDLRRTRVADDCTVLRGVLEDPYTGERIEFTAEDPMEVQIDHVVPLALAWRTGAREWDGDTRVAFANDPGNLIAADGPANQSKGDSGPGEWRPYPPFRCSYAVTYIGVIDEYGLWLPPDDHAALGAMLRTC